MSGSVVKKNMISKGERKIILNPYDNCFDLKDTSMKNSRKLKMCREEILEEAVGRLQGKHKTLLDSCNTLVEDKEFTEHQN